MKAVFLLQFLATVSMQAQLLSFHSQDLERVSETNSNKVWEVSATTSSSWNELVPSWNVVNPTGTFIHVQVKIPGSKWYSMGFWSSDPAQKRQSVLNQKDELARIETDTLITSGLHRQFTLRIEGAKNSRGEAPLIKYVGVSLHNRSTSPSNFPKLRATKVLDVPQRSQLGHADAQGWCSPTCISMVLAYWGKHIDFDVPTTAAAIHDPNWPGTGNWSFNMAYAGQFPGIRAVIHRLQSLKQVHSLVNAGIPVPISVSFDHLNGKEKDEGNGHLVVVIGFDGNGNVLINDPWPDPKGINSIRKTIPVERVHKAWQRSLQTVYLVAPEEKLAPFLKEFATEKPSETRLP